MKILSTICSLNNKIIKFGHIIQIVMIYIFVCNEITMISTKN